MRIRGITYDTGFAPWGPELTRPELDAGQVREELRVIRRELHCNAVRITGALPERIALAAEAALDEGLAVWFSPFPCNREPEELAAYFVRAASLAESLRTPGADVTYVMGCELTTFDRGFLPGDDPMQRLQALLDPSVLERAGITPDAIVARFQAFLTGSASAVRDAFRGPVTYASGSWEPVDWAPFDVVAIDHYLDANSRGSYRETLEGLTATGKPVVVSEVGCCSYRGAEERGAMGWAVVDRSTDPPRLTEAVARDEEAQVRYLDEVLSLLGGARIDGAFWFTFAGYANPYRDDPALDLDRASYGVVRVLPAPASGGYAGLPWQPKAAFHALAARYARMDRV